MSAMPPIDDPVHDAVAVELGRVILWERAQLPPLVLGQCEIRVYIAHRPGPDTAERAQCSRIGMLVRRVEMLELFAARHADIEVFLCPRHGATLDRAVRREAR